MGTGLAAWRYLVSLYDLLRPLLFRLDAETAHRTTFALLAVVEQIPGLARLLVPAAPRGRERLRCKVSAGDIASPLGLAAGLDKNGVRSRALAALGFGFLELGTVTPRPQEGNPRPRLVRYPDARSLENWMGFNNAGSETLARRLSRRRPPVPIWVNLGKNRDTSNAKSAQDYLAAAQPLQGLVDAYVVNLSSPNTPGLRELQSEAFLRQLGEVVLPRLDAPVLVKFSPDLPGLRAALLAETALSEGADGLVLTNTTTDYSLLPRARGRGGLSGRVLAEKSFGQLQEVASAVPHGTLLVSVGGVDSIEEVTRRLDAGASLVELFTGLVYEGPGLMRRLERELLAEMDRRGIERLESWTRGGAQEELAAQ